MNRNSIFCALVSGILALASSSATAQSGGSYALTWSTIDGGGSSSSIGATYELRGTIGQHDAGPAASGMSGGNYVLVGGFWPAAPCVCVGDLNSDTLRDGQDVQEFLNCLLDVGVNCRCTDLNHDGVLDNGDVVLFVSAMLTSGPCP